MAKSKVHVAYVELNFIPVRLQEVLTCRLVRFAPQKVILGIAVLIDVQIAARRLSKVAATPSNISHRFEIGVVVSQTFLTTDFIPVIDKRRL